MTAKKIIPVVEEIFELYQKHGSNEYAGEKVSQLEHMVQAAQLAKEGGYDDEIVLAVFLHDIGHICAASYITEDMNGFGVMNHEKIGANFLRKRGFSERIARLVENHVSAKRYLTFKHPAYYEGLSEASKKTLEFQGGKMNPDEAILFEQDELFAEFIAMRRWDELAKEENLPLQPMDYFKDLMINYLQRQYSFNTI
jgi:2-amino-1-hydroxyethylphosphonate dioxygenase (glycine-forming)